MSGSGKISPEDQALFRASVGQVRPVKKIHAELPRKRKPAIPQQTLNDERAVLAEMAEGSMDIADVEVGDELLYRRPGVQTRLLSQLRRGYFVVEAELDLHGLTAATAKVELTDFLARSQRQNRRCVRIIHGKGRGSRDGKPVLKNKLNVWLQLRDDVLAFCSARANDGGTGAAYVLLRQQRRY
ncbi:MAG: Smr/MutS family protein [Gammaproteobacteria bacterium]